ncbi:tRNA dimethylallyltransferase, mitochondrial [Coemansia sp. RSA 1813]|nr:tRNA dimethylallyltransferase, mitochondrial [Coemansia sp. RSA 1646]KAJ1768467.1 tRNA dimethylallyltransferase, mitochondrial [Coemansia sp. RSA 1843]KAJ2087930.1 tRNA dimethylallyltransferase, mitochondrial [Coemansia sp. RSA 986]KAJ2212875.1 tRNA dimethylallyltransferase, mitochondrial [Coemansia sp. RSA 487]KAJ2567644.1 tRNA dimethylallyltransferase, mitochondrial [Coemansia sp. RSA 1813]
MEMALVRKGLIAITGTTGVGKSQLAIELARAVNGEVINADALQVYKGYDIITNKVTKDETLRVPHHLLGFVEPSKEYSVQRFEQDALQKIGEIHQRNRVPILVGGTNYYIQSVLFRKSLINSSRTVGSLDDPADAEKTPAERAFEASKTDVSNQELWEELRRVDPPMAEKWHPNNRRKVLRSLEVSCTTGKKHSEWIQESEAARGKEETLRFPTLLFWLYADTNVLNKRLDERVDKMVDRGLFDEVSQLAKDLNNANALSGPSGNFSLGLKQAIGFREFDPYLKATAIAPDAGGSGCVGSKAEVLKQNGIADMKTSTRRYAKRQISWIRNKLIPECRATAEKSTRAHAYILDASDLGSWDTCVQEKGVDIAKRFMSNESLPDAANVSPAAEALFAEIKGNPESLLSWKRHYCNVCSKTADEAKDGVAYDVWLNGDDEYNQHLRSRQHKKNLRYRKRILPSLGDRSSQDSDTLAVPAKRINLGSDKSDNAKQ